ncbi:dATP/dGTP diphosphohydrolase domain-containing protein [Metapseudomonas otitidis]|uniref:dATP/dGTP diphosphohydrolase domain-containing protein n=1 Tax=Metapseudomonas otitidis TaxID=319939 RepID=UPI00366B33C5
MTDTKPTNPKDAIGSGKLPLHLWPATATALGSLGLLDGMLKYGRSNFRAIGVRASIYYDAACRHLNAWFEGEEEDPDSGLPHLAHALACLAIIVDAKAAGKLNDDRCTPGGYRNLVSELTGHVSRLKDLHAGKSPTHYTIQERVE